MHLVTRPTMRHRRDNTRRGAPPPV